MIEVKELPSYAVVNKGDKDCTEKAEYNKYIWKELECYVKANKK